MSTGQLIKTDKYIYTFFLVKTHILHIENTQTAKQILLKHKNILVRPRKRTPDQSEQSYHCTAETNEHEVKKSYCISK